ncbi:MAG: ABC transporter ATP-binding protein [Pseudomonadota bacterium]
MTNTQAVWRLFRELGDLRWYQLPLISLGVLVTVLEGAGLFLLMPIFATLLGMSGEGEPIQPTGFGLLDDLLGDVADDTRLVALILVVMAIIILKNLAQYVDAVGWTWYDAVVNKRIQAKLFARLMANDPRDKFRGPGRSMNTFENQSWRAVDALLGVAQAFVDLCGALFFVILLVILSWQMSLIVLVCGVGIYLLVSFLTRRVETLGTELVETQEEVSRRLWDILTGLKTIWIFGSEAHEKKRFDRAINDTVMTGLRQERISAAVDPIIETIVALLIGVVCLLSIGQDLSVLPALGSFVLILRRLIPRLQALIGVRVELSAEIASVHNILPLLEPPLETSRPIQGAPFRGLETDIEVDGLSYTYGDDDELALDNVHLTVSLGKINGLAGPSGAGKSTLVDLLCRILVPASGRISANGRDVSDFSLATWRQKLGTVSQDIHLFRASIRDNIAYGLADVSTDEIVAAAKAANAHDFIVKHPEGYDRILTENGADLSGGQRQRLALARALIRHPDVLILDEATSALDPLAETLVKEALAARPKGCTVIVIAHRATTLQIADRIVVLEDGHVVQTGTWDELIGAPGLFQRMFQSAG